MAGIFSGLAMGGIAGWIIALPLANRIENGSRFLPALWRIAVVAALVLVLLPLDPKATLARTALADWNLPERVYQLLKPAMLWAGLGLVCGVSGYSRQARRWGGAGVFSFLVCAFIDAENFRFEDVVEIMALLPGLAMGLWLGERSKLAGATIQVEVHGTIAVAGSDGKSPLSSPAPYDVSESREDVRISRIAVTPVPELFTKSESGREAQEEAGRMLRPLSAMSIFVRRAFALMLLTVVGWALIDFPLWNTLLAGSFVLYAALLLRYPKAWLFVIPAALPLFDLAFWTGRFFLDEFDMLLAVSMAVLLWRVPVKCNDPGTPLPVVFILLIIASVLISGAIGLLPLQPLDANTFASYLSHYNSLRVAKGFLWGLVLFVMLRPHLREMQSIRLFSAGMLTGLAGVSISALWEFWRFSDSSAPDYRVTATFSSMHIGGGHIEAYLVFALPFIWLLLWQEKRIWVKTITISVFILAIYALITTVARGGIVALAAVFITIAVAMYRTRRAGGVSRSQHYTTGVLLAGGVAVVIAGIATATFLQQRFAQTDADAQTRFSHWFMSVGLLRDNLSERLFGAGLGTFPERYFYANFDSALGIYRYQTEGENHYLSLNSGGTLYMAQSVAVSPYTAYTLELDLRSNDKTGSLNVSICEKKLFNSHLCQWLSAPVTPGIGWQHQKIEFSSGAVGQGSWWLRRPVQLSLYNPQEKGVVDVDNIRLAESNSVNLISNGDFAKGGDYWFFKSGNHLPWHTKSMWVHLLFEQGLMGIAIFLVLTVISLRNLMRGTWAGEPGSTVWLASLAGLLTIGVEDSLFDAPRLAMLLVLVLLVGVSHRMVRAPR